MRKNRSASLAAVLGLLCTTGCGPFFINPNSLPGATGSGGNYVYVANATAETLTGYSIGTGTLTAIANGTASLGFVPTAVVVNPTDGIVFVAGNSLIYAFAINGDGSLTVLNGGSAVGASDVASMVISPDGQWLLALDGNSVTLDEFQINSTTGTLTQVTGASYTVAGATVVPRSVAISPNGQLVFIALGTGGDLVYTFDTTSGLLANSQQLNPISATTSDNALAVSPSGNYLYIARSGTAPGLAVYAIGTAGALTPVTGSPFAAGTQPSSVAINVAGTDVYVGNRGSGTISGYSIASTGALTALTGSPYSSGSAVSALVAERSGTYLLAAANGGSPDLTMYSFDATTVGKLDQATSTSTGTDPTGPVALAVTH